MSRTWNVPQHTPTASAPRHSTLATAALWVAIVAGVVFTVNVLVFDVIALSTYIRVQSAVSELTDIMNTAPSFGDTSLPSNYCDPTTGMQLDGTYC